MHSFSTFVYEGYVVAITVAFVWPVTSGLILKT